MSSNLSKETVAADNRYKALAALVGCAVLWSVGGVFIKSVSLNPLAIAGFRSAIAAVVFLIYVKKPQFKWSFAQIGGAVSYAGTVMFFVSATKLTTAANAILLQYTAPIFVAVLSWWLLKEKVSVRDWITIAVVMSGMLLFFLDDLKSGGLLGNILAILSGLCFASQAIFMRMQKDASPAESILIGNIAAALIGAPFIFEKLPNISDMTGLLILGIFQLGLSYILYSYAVKYVSALEATLIPVVEPILNPIWVIIFIGEIPGKWAIIGGIIVLAAITLRCTMQELEKRDKKGKNNILQEIVKNNI